MIDVFVVFAGQNGQRTTIPGGPFPDLHRTNIELYHFGVRQADTWIDFLTLIDGFGYVFLDTGKVTFVR